MSDLPSNGIRSPSKERERIASLVRYQILDSPAEDEFDALTAFIADTCRAPMAVVSLVDVERLWFKSRVGLAEPEASRSASFCACAIEEPRRLLVVEDALQDQRFAASPLVTGALGIRFYAGFPIVSSDGYPLGTICILDTEPRSLPVEHEKALRVVARMIQVLLEQRYTIATLEESKKQQSRIELTLRQEVFQRTEAETKALFASAHDALTQLLNRNAFKDRLQKKIEDIQADRSSFCAVALIDLDHFKQVNDSLGHLTGDDVLVRVAAQLSKISASKDTVARLGGDEFIILLNDVCGDAESRVAAKRIESALRLDLSAADYPAGMSASVGIVSLNKTYFTVDEVLRDADLAMYEAKRLGRSGSLVFSEDLRRTFEEETRVDSIFRESFRDGHLWIAYQPIFDFSDLNGAPIGFEALLRFTIRDCDHRVTLQALIEAAERTGLIVELGYWIFSQACAQASRWEGQLGRLPPITTVNVSARQLSHPDFAEAIKAIIVASKVDPSIIGIEVTESVLIEDVNASLKILDTLRAFGVRIYLDDFGTGFSSLSYLRRLPVDLLKIDRSFVSGQGDHLADPIIVESIISLAHRLKLLVVAEGVETGEQSAALQLLGCNFAQGFLYSRPLTADKAAIMLSKHCATQLISPSELSA